MRLLNINTGFLEFKNIEDVKDKYIAISHRWLNNEIELLELGLVGLGNNINIGEKLYDDLYSKIKCSTVLNNIQIPIIENLKIRHDGNYQKWNDYLKFKNIIENYDLCKEFDNHYKLIKIINNIIYNNKEIKYIWLDTLCIDKSSSAELSENIVSMFKIYENAKYVYVYLNNSYVGYENKIEYLLDDEWFTRAWTLQEYLANHCLKIYDVNNNFICNKNSIWKYMYKYYYANDSFKYPSYLIKFDTDYYEYSHGWSNYAPGYRDIIDINVKHIFTYRSSIFLRNIPIGTVLSWMEKRVSTRLEDKVYSLMGILNTYIMPLYGEGFENAMNRFINEYILNKIDDTLFDCIVSRKVKYAYTNITEKRVNYYFSRLDEIIEKYNLNDNNNIEEIMINIIKEIKNKDKDMNYYFNKHYIDSDFGIDIKEAIKKYNNKNLNRKIKNLNFNIKEIIKINGNFKITAPINIINKKYFKYKKTTKNNLIHINWCKERKIYYKSIDYKSLNFAIYELFYNKKLIGIFINESDNFHFMSKEGVSICFVIFSEFNIIISVKELSTQIQIEILKIGKFIPVIDFLKIIEKFKYNTFILKYNEF